jgi:iron complex outermembrane receptor protein
MITRIRLLLAFLFLQVHLYAQNDTIIVGNVFDEEGIPIEGATVTSKDGNFGAITDKEGIFTLAMPKAIRYLSVTYQGKGAVEVDVNRRTTIIMVRSNPIFTSEMMNTLGVKRQEKNLSPRTIESEKMDPQLLNPELSFITQGPGILKPVIRGMAFDRLFMVKDSIVHKSQQWQNIYSLEVDPLEIKNMEVLRGVKSLPFGPNAMSGFLNVQNIPEVDNGQVRGSLDCFLRSRGYYQFSAAMGTTFKKITFDVQMTQTAQTAYRNKYDGRVQNSQFSKTSASWTLGLINPRTIARLRVGWFSEQAGTIEGRRDSLGRFLKYSAEDSLTLATDEDFSSVEPQFPKQSVDHFLTSLEAIHIFKDNTKLAIRSSWQRNSIKDYNDYRDLKKEAVKYILNSGTINLQATHNFGTIVGLTAGVSSDVEDSRNVSKLLLIPDYRTFNIAPYFITGLNYKGSLGLFQAEAGIRYDWKGMRSSIAQTDSMGNKLSLSYPDPIHRFSSFSANFHGLSGDVELSFVFYKAKYTVPYIKLNTAFGWRPPNILELKSQGIQQYRPAIHLSGNNYLKPERNIELTLSLGMKSPSISFDFSVFSNFLTNVIYQRQQKTILGKDSIRNDLGFGPAYAFTYDQQKKALSFGGEALIEIHPPAAWWLKLAGGFSLVHFQLQNAPDTLKYLPFTPSPRIFADLRLQYPKHIKGLETFFLKLDFSYSFAKTNVYRQPQIYQTLSPDLAAASVRSIPQYFVINLGVGNTFLVDGKPRIGLYVSLSNLVNATYRDYLSNVKYAPINSVTNRVGVFDVGRSINLLIHVPLNFSIKPKVAALIEGRSLQNQWTSDNLFLSLMKHYPKDTADFLLKTYVTPQQRQIFSQQALRINNFRQRGESWDPLIINDSILNAVKVLSNPSKSELGFIDSLNYKIEELRILLEQEHKASRYKRIINMIMIGELKNNLPSLKEFSEHRNVFTPQTVAKIATLTYDVNSHLQQVYKTPKLLNKPLAKRINYLIHDIKSLLEILSLQSKTQGSLGFEFDILANAETVSLSLVGDNKGADCQLIYSIKTKWTDRIANANSADYLVFMIPSGNYLTNSRYPVIDDHRVKFQPHSTDNTKIIANAQFNCLYKIIAFNALDDQPIKLHLTNLDREGNYVIPSDQINPIDHTYNDILYIDKGNQKHGK